MIKGVCSILVIMPVYNAGLFVKEAIESILNQTFADFELIIVDDASTDDTSEIAQSYKDERILYLRNQTNLGNYPSRNRGMDLAQGKYIAVMDGDDIAMPDRLEKQYNYMEANPQLIAVSTNYEKEEGEEDIDYPYSYSDIYLSLLKGFYLLHPSLMIKTHILRLSGGYKERYKYAADYDMVCRLAFQGRIECLPDCLMIHRKHEFQISQFYSEDQNRYAARIRRSYQILFINHYKEERQAAVTLAQVGVSTVGMAICYYTYAIYTKDKKYEKLGNEIIDVIYKITTKELPLTLIGGLCGLGCGLLYMLRNHLLEGEENEVLEEIDNIILNAFNLPEKQNTDKEEDMLFYLKYRNLLYPL